MQIRNVQVFTISYLTCRSKDRSKSSKPARRSKPSWANSLSFSPLLILRVHLLPSKACRWRSFSPARLESICMLKWLTILTTIPSCSSASRATILQRFMSTNLKEWKIWIGSTSFNGSALETAPINFWTTSRRSLPVLSSRCSWDAFTATSSTTTVMLLRWRAHSKRQRSRLRLGNEEGLEISDFLKI